MMKDRNLPLAWRSWRWDYLITEYGDPHLSHLLEKWCDDAGVSEDHKWLMNQGRLSPNEIIDELIEVCEEKQHKLQAILIRIDPPQ